MNWVPGCQGPRLDLCMSSFGTGFAKWAACDNELCAWKGGGGVFHRDRFGITLDTVNNCTLLSDTVGQFAAGPYGEEAAQGNFPFYSA